MPYGRQHRPKKNRQTGEWTYPARKDVFEEVGLYTLEEYILRRRKSIASYIRDRPIFDLCNNETTWYQLPSVLA